MECPVCGGDADRFRTVGGDGSFGFVGYSQVCYDAEGGQTLLYCHPSIEI